MDLHGPFRTRHLEVISDIDKFLIEKDTSGLYTTLINKKKAIRNSQTGFWVYFYKIDPENLDNHKEFDFYHLKIQRSEQIIKKIIQLKLPERLKKGINELARHSEELISKKDKKRIDVNLYRRQVTDLISEMIPQELNLYEDLKLHTTDLVRNLPKLNEPVIIEAYFIPNKDKKTNHENGPTLPFEMSRSIVGNNFVLPVEVIEDGVEVWYGHSPGPKIGRGFKEIWRKIGNQWECIQWNSTWIS